MPVNPYFNQTTFQTEQNLINDLIIESIQIYGHSAYYLRREDVNIDAMFYEDPLMMYPNASEIEIYIKSSAGFTGPSDSVSKFGLFIEDRALFLVAATRFAQVEPTLPRPRENDIIFIQFTPTTSFSGPPFRYLFEIRFVEKKEQFFQLGNLYTYEMRCELMNYGSERVVTGNTAIDMSAQQEAYSITLQFGTGNGTYQFEETVYQGASFVDALATATVFSWNANTLSLVVQNVTGAFVGNAAVIGITSNANYTTSVTPDTAPETGAPTITGLGADNTTITTQVPGIVDPRNNPRYNI